MNAQNKSQEKGVFVIVGNSTDIYEFRFPNLKQHLFDKAVSYYLKTQTINNYLLKNVSSENFEALENCLSFIYEFNAHPIYHSDPTDYYH